MSCQSITAVTPTICNMLGIPAPDISESPLLDYVIHRSKVEFGSGKLQKCLFYSPDAIGKVLYDKHTELFDGVLQNTNVKVPLTTVFPPKTPVCYASMFTGSFPEVHGIKKYEKPVLVCETIFDKLIEYGVRVAVVAVKDSSIDRLFRDRTMEYFSEVYDNEVINRAISLLESNVHDFVLVYNQEYDDVMHATTPECPEAMQALKNHIDGFSKLASNVNKYWGKYNRLITFAPDHGIHLDNETGKGTHGENISDDMEVMHFYGLYKGVGN